MLPPATQGVRPDPTPSRFPTRSKFPNACGTCGASNGDIRTEDIAPYFTIVVIGHVVIAPLMMIEQVYSPSLWVHLLVWPPLSILATFFRYHVLRVL